MPVIILLLLLLLLLPAAASAEDEGTRNFMGETPRASDLVDALRLEQELGQTRGLGKTRAIQIERHDCSVVTRAIRIIPTKSAILDIKFNFDSDELTGPAQSILDELGMALKASELAGQRFVVEGHTDASGSDLYNRELSKRRAMKVRDYLNAWHGIELDRLAISCKGETELLEPDDPSSGVNRRVHIINMG